jgi:hypothetical protein
MRNVPLTRSSAQLEPSRSEPEPTLTVAERRNVALAALQIEERRHRLQLARIAAERRALLSGAGSSPHP